MKIDVLVEYDSRLSEVTFSSNAAQFTQTIPARIGLSRLATDDSGHEMVEFIGEDWERLKELPDLFNAESSRKGWILRIINPFEPATFESVAAFRMIDFFSRYIFADFYPKTWTWRSQIPFLTTYDLTLKVPGYDFFNPQKKEEFEKLLRKKFKSISFVS